MCVIANLTSHVGFKPGQSSGNCCKQALILIFVLIVSSLGVVCPVKAENGDDFHVVVIVSLNIRPYMDAVQGIHAEVQKASKGRLDVFFLEPDRDDGHLRLTKALNDSGFKLMIAVGPEAMDYIWSTFPEADTVKIFCMVLNPERIVQNDLQLCGVPLNIPAQIQLREFTARLPTLKRLGLVFNPATNSAFAASAMTATQSLGINLISLKINSLADILPVFRSQLNRIDALWVIPDRSVVSESLIPYIIKEAMANNVAVLGYNQYFMDAGAAISLVRDYEAIGQQTASMALDMLTHRQCRLEPPRFNVHINQRVLKTLGYSDEPDPSHRLMERQP